MITLEAGQVWRPRYDEASARRIVSVTDTPPGVTVEYVHDGQTLTDIGTSFRRWIDINGATLVEDRGGWRS